MIFYPNDELVNLGGIYLGPTTNKIVEYNVVIEIMSEALSLNTQNIIVRMESQLVVSQLNHTYLA
jgi:ribonuclease HI